MGNTAEKIAGESLPFTEHEYKISKTTYSNGAYSYGGGKEVYTSPGYVIPPSGGATGPTGCIGSHGCTGPTGCTGDSDPGPEALKLKVKEFDAFMISVIPKENTKESYFAMGEPYVSEYSDAGVEIRVREPVVVVHKTPKPEHEQDVKNLENLQKHCNRIRTSIYNIYSKAMKGEEFKVSDYSTEFDLYTKEVFNSAVKTMLEDILKFKKNGHTCSSGSKDVGYRENSEDENSEDEDEEVCGCGCEPSLQKYAHYSPSIPVQWYNYTREILYNEYPKLTLKCHEGTQMYAEITKLIEAHQLEKSSS